MVKLTAAMIGDSPQYTNTLKDREIDLRGYKLSVIENLGATLDQFDCIDLSDNDIKKVENFPLLKRLRMLLMNNNRVCRFEDNLQESLPQLETLTLTNNNVSELIDIEPLKTVKSLRNLSFLRNPVATKPNYRLYVIHCLSQVKVLDFQRIRMKEREAAKKLFSGKKGEILRKDIAAKRQKTFEVKDIITTNTEEDENFMKEKFKDQEAIKIAIANASTLEEVRKLELLLQKGHIPGKTLEKGDEKTNRVETTDINEIEVEEDIIEVTKQNGEETVEVMEE